jgi:hypothetical protein
MHSSLRIVVAAAVLLLAGQSPARADVVLDWNAIALRTLSRQNPFFQARFMAMTQLAVFEAVNAVNGGYESYGKSIAADPNASTDAAAIAAAHAVLLSFNIPDTAEQLSIDRADALAAIPDGAAKSAGIALGKRAARKIIWIRKDDGSAPMPPVPLHLPSSALAGEWQLTPTPPSAPQCIGGQFTEWPKLLPFGIPDAQSFILEPPPDLGSNRYAKDYLEVKTMGGVSSTGRPQDRSDVARFYASISPSHLLNMAARQMSVARGDSLSANAWALALLNMAVNDALVVSFATKYTHVLWRPVTAIRAGDSDRNPKTEGDPSFTPLITTPCFPAYPSNHASGTNSGLEVLRRIYGAAGHSLLLSNPVGLLSPPYSSLKQISDDVDDARVYGGIHFRFDQEAGGRLGREVATYVYKHNLRKTNAPE